MADYTGSKKGLGSVFPDGAVESVGEHVEPLITPTLLKSRHLFGIPLVSQIRNPNTGKFDEMTDDILKDYIQTAVATAEVETSIDIFPRQLQEKMPYDKVAYYNFGYFSLNHRPCASIESLALVTSNAQNIYQVDLSWVETARLARGQINLIPIGINMADNSGVVTNAGTSGAAAFIAILANYHWIPSLWQISYTTGFPDGMLPKIVNRLVGTIAAQDVLSMLASTYAKHTSVSLGLDGMSQGTSGPGAQIFALRMQELAAQRKLLVNKLKQMYGTKQFSDWV